MDIKYSLMTLLEESTANEYGVDVPDATSIDFSTFSWQNGFYKHKITKNELVKPYLISYAYYGTVIYEDMILLLNGILDIWDCPVGTEIRIPKFDDLKAFIRDNKVS